MYSDNTSEYIKMYTYNSSIRKGAFNNNKSNKCLELSRRGNTLALLYDNSIKENAHDKMMLLRKKLCQTVYRESSDQSHVFEPDVYSNKDFKKFMEVNSIATFIKGKDIGEFEVCTIERFRKRRMYEKWFKKIYSTGNKTQTQIIPLAFEWENWIAKEDDIENIQMQRMNITQARFSERENACITTSDSKLKFALNDLSEKKESEINNIKRKYVRDLRKIDSKYSNLTNQCFRSKVVNEHIDRSSDLYGPQMRHGVHPKRRHFEGHRNRFLYRLDNFNEKVKFPNVFKCPLRNINEFSKPKEKIKNVSQRFEGDQAFKEVYDHLKILRESCTSRKGQPNCLKYKLLNNLPSNTKISEDSHLTITNEPPCRKLEDKTHVSEQSSVSSYPIFTDQAHQEANCIVSSVASCSQHQVDESLRNADNTDHIITKFEAITLGPLFPLLEQERNRKIELKRVNDACKLAENERRKREAAEAGMRQKENFRRVEQEDSFRDSFNITSRMADLFFQNVLKEENEIRAKSEAESVINQEAKSFRKNDQFNQKTNAESAKSCEDEKIINSLLNTFVYPEVQKRLSRQTEQLDKTYSEGNVESFIHQYFGSDLLQRSVAEENVHIVHGIMPQIFHNVIPSDETSSESSLTDEECKHETKGIINTLIKRTIPKRHWMTTTERIIKETLEDIITDVNETVVKCSISKYEKSNATVQRILKDLKNQLSDFNREKSNSMLSANFAMHQGLSSFESFPKAGRSLNCASSKYNLIEQGIHLNTRYENNMDSSNADMVVDYSMKQLETFECNLDDATSLQPIESTINLVEKINVPIESIYKKSHTDSDGLDHNEYNTFTKPRDNMNMSILSNEMKMTVQNIAIENKDKHNVLVDAFADTKEGYTIKYLIMDTIIDMTVNIIGPNSISTDLICGILNDILNNLEIN